MSLPRSVVIRRRRRALDVSHATFQPEPATHAAHEEGAHPWPAP